MGMRGCLAIFYVRRAGIFSGGGFSGRAAAGVAAQLFRAWGDALAAAARLWGSALGL